LPTDKQQGVLRGMAAGAITTLIALSAAIVAHPRALTPNDGYPAALAARRPGRWGSP
jgi:hypothetical protein